ncbi:MAG: immunoglobulin domain-containing protein, partial [Opitutaceae bacterium]|nr:immunoglobulin domain-containing protein [Opitutaceae bacterium]
ASDSFVLTVSAVNDTPTISNIADRTIGQDTGTGSIAFTIGDVETSTSSLSLTASSSNTSLVSNASIAFGGSGANRTVAITPAAGQSGTTTITVTVSDGTASASDTFVLTVSSTDVAPTITSQPASVTVVAGASASFSVAATGSPAPAYQWRLNGAAIAGATGSSYAVSGAQVSHAGTYTVVVSNAAGSVTSAGATLTVNDAIAIIAQPESQTIAKGTKATLSVTATGSGLGYQWFAGEAGDVTAPITGATSAAYTTPKLSTTKGYWVRVSGAGQSVDSVTALVSVVDAPRTGSGSVKRGNRATEAAPVLSASTAADGTFAVMIGQDGTLQMLAIDAASGVLIDAGGVPVDDAGNFSFPAAGLGTVTGQVAGSLVSGSVVGTDITFSGTIAAVDGSTQNLAGWYNGVVVNSSNDEVIVVVGADGTAFVLAYTAGSAAGGLFLVDTSGAVNVTLPDGRALNLSISGASGRMSGTTVAAGRTDKVSGNRAGDALEKRLVNTSVRAQVRSGDGLMVAGFVVSGTGNKRVLIRAVGPTLANFGLSGVLANPVVALFRQGETTALARNDDWSSAANAADVAATASAVGAFRLASGSKDAALLVDLPAGNYTAQVSGASGETGMALVEVYDVDSGGALPTNLANISMRGIAGNGDDLVIAGFVVTGNAPKQVLIRAVGPELSRFGLAGVAADPYLTIFSRMDGKEVQIATNNDWGVDAAAVSVAGDQVGAFKLASGSKSSAMVIWLEPGVYTAQASSNIGSSGVAIVEVYEVQ